MTICIAAMGNENQIILSCDRMLTAGDIQYEPPTAKIYKLATCKAAMIAGEDISIHTQIFNIVQGQVKGKEDEFTTEQYAELLRRAFFKILKDRQQNEILSAYQLDETYYKKGATDPVILNEVMPKLWNFKLPWTGVIVVGIDDKKAHIYTMINGEVSCADYCGFASIGEGDWHARSYFMFRKHSHFTQTHEAFLTTVFAKKRAEVASTVGEITDMFVISQDNFLQLPRTDIDAFESIYTRYTQRCNDHLITANAELGDVLKKLLTGDKK